MFSCKCFIVSGLTFKSSILFKFIFVYGVRNHSDFTLTWSCPVLPAPFIEPPLSKNKVPVGAWVYFWAFCLFFSFFFSVMFISWRLITLQYCSAFCHTFT